MEKGSKRWAKVAQEIQSHKRFLVTTHVNPDGDGIGSGIALMGHLSALGKDAVMVSSDPLPERYRFLDPERHIKTYDPSTSVGLKEEVIFVLDTSELTRLGRVQEVVENRKDQVISIDHHPLPLGRESGAMVYLCQKKKQELRLFLCRFLDRR